MSDTSGVYFFPVMAALVGMAVGFVTIWTQIRGQGRTAKQDMESAKLELEKRVRDYLALKLENIEMQINHLKEDVSRLERKLNNKQQKEDSFS